MTFMESYVSARYEVTSMKHTCALCFEYCRTVCVVCMCPESTTRSITQNWLDYIGFSVGGRACAFTLYWSIPGLWQEVGSFVAAACIHVAGWCHSDLQCTCYSRTLVSYYFNVLFFKLLQHKIIWTTAMPAISKWLHKSKTNCSAFCKEATSNASAILHVA